MYMFCGHKPVIQLATNISYFFQNINYLMISNMTSSHCVVCMLSSASDNIQAKNIKFSQNNFFFLCCTLAWFWVMASPYGCWQSHSLDTPHSVGLLWMRDELYQKPVPDNTHHSQEMNYHAAGRIQTHSPSKGATTDLHLSPRGHWDQPSWNNRQRKYIILWNNSCIELYYTGVNNVWCKSLFLYFPYCSVL